ncbi:Hypothetical predicted protein [Olea europaea subsp. europaea]|uniref:Uncharacterized protein n=1 Tax=Olea europaea subsp. europaea TaxID=158383 RepID=A0A8S0VFG5_OLEEU|nr:Hypothetical predicted protein [Olea europaea subsp. europaea]
MPSYDAIQSMFSNAGLGSFFVIKNLDAKKVFIVKESNEEGMWNKLNEVSTFSERVKELMQQANGSRHMDYGWKIHANSYFSKSLRNSKKRGVAFLKGAANSMSGLIVDKEREQLSLGAQRVNKK